MKFRCPKCRKILVATGAVLMCLCGEIVPSHSHFDDEPAPRSAVYAQQTAPNILLGSRLTGPVPNFVHTQPQSSQRWSSYTEMPQGLTALHYAEFARLAARRMPVLYVAPIAAA
jgi:hypothetical protein